MKSLRTIPDAARGEGRASGMLGARGGNGAGHGPQAGDLSWLVRLNGVVAPADDAEKLAGEALSIIAGVLPVKLALWQADPALSDGWLLRVSEHPEEEATDPPLRLLAVQSLGSAYMRLAHKTPATADTLSIPAAWAWRSGTPLFLADPASDSDDP